jgi:hypothetical protein
MKGKLIKIEERWMVGTVCYADLWSNYIPLHPDDVKQIGRDSQVFDNIEARIAAYPNVEFEIIDEFTHPELFTNVGWGDGIKYAKLIQSKEQQKQLITEIMDLDAKDGLYDTVNDTVNELDKLAEKTFKGDDATVFVQREIWKDGYKKAKETLYTEEQVRKAMKYASEITNNKMKYMEDYIQSLKKLKKD